MGSFCPIRSVAGLTALYRFLTQFGFLHKEFGAKENCNGIHILIDELETLTDLRGNTRSIKASENHNLRRRYFVDLPCSTTRGTATVQKVDKGLVVGAEIIRVLCATALKSEELVGTLIDRIGVSNGDQKMRLLLGLMGETGVARVRGEGPLEIPHSHLHTLCNGHRLASTFRKFAPTGKELRLSTRRGCDFRTGLELGFEEEVNNREQLKPQERSLSPTSLGRARRHVRTGLVTSVTGIG